MSKTDEDRWQAIPYDVYFIGDDKCQLIAKSHKETVFKCSCSTVPLTQGLMAPIVLLVASCIVPL